ncbi:MAG: hypothetical protein H6700_09755 [Myxococcales bacterium]|nr:hypothetical protein [Myxococcales bacterium]
MSFFKIDGARPVGAGLHSPAGSITDEELARTVERYKRLVASRYRAVGPTELESLGDARLLVSPKIDGETWFLVLEPDRVALLNPRGRVLSGAIPVLDEARVAARKTTERVVLAGELFALRPGGRPRHGDLANALSGGAQADVDRIGFTAFDVVPEGFDDGSLTAYSERMARAAELLAGGKRLRSIATDDVRGAAAVRDLYARWVESEKAEGLIARAEGRVWKIKPVFHLDAVIVGFTLRGEDPSQVRSLLLGVVREPGQVQIIGSCGGLGDDESRRTLRARLETIACASTFRHASSDGALYQLVVPEVVAEIRVSDIQAEGSDGEPTPRMVIAHTPDAGWTGVTKMPGVSLLSPVLSRLRDDKRADETDAGFGQIAQRVLVPEIATHVQATQLPTSTILRREVWQKALKGRLAVRKLVIWATNKQEHDPRYPAFVVHWTDYSPNRKDPLQRTVRLAATEERAWELADDLVAENIKSGWDLVVRAQ